MDANVVQHLPFVIGALGVLGAGVISIVKGYRWLLSEIRSAITDAMAHHEHVEGEWQRDIERRLEAIENKVDRLIERHNGQ